MLKQGIAANEYIYTALIDACAKRMDVQTAERVMRAAWDDPSIKPNVQMLTSIIDLHARAGQHGKVKAVWEQMEARGVEPDTAAVNAVITALDKSGSLEEAREVFLRVRSEQRVRLDCVSYSAMLDAYAKRGLVAEAAALLEEMRASGIAPDSAMLVSLVDLYGKSGAPHKARQALHALCDYASRHLEDAAVQQADGAGRAGAAGEKQGAAGGRGSSASMVRSDVRRAFNTLIDANLRFGQAEAARSLRKELDEAAGRGLSAAADVFTYTILVGHIEVGPEAAGEARALYDDMMAARVAPDAAFFFSALEVIVKSGEEK
jgi:pentatricopeptide repeat protein